MSWLAADIGGTHSRLAWVMGDGVRIGHYQNAGFSDLYQVIERFVDEHAPGGASMAGMVLALPGPFDPERMRLTNIDWQVSRETLMRRFGARKVRLLNDFQAAAVGVLHAERVRVLQAGRVSPDNRCAVVTGVGTGLGLAWCADIEARGLPQATEGGHADFAPSDESECALRAWLAARHGHVSRERVLSGQGLSELYAWLVAGDPLPPAEVQRRAEAGDAPAVGAVRHFVRILVRHLGDLALQFDPGAGLYLCGGVAVHLADWIARGFDAGFTDKGRMRPWLERIPVRLVEDFDIGLQGAIRIAREVADGSA